MAASRFDLAMLLAIIIVVSQAVHGQDVDFYGVRTQDVTISCYLSEFRRLFPDASIVSFRIAVDITNDGTTTDQGLLSYSMETGGVSDATRLFRLKALPGLWYTRKVQTVAGNESLHLTLVDIQVREGVDLHFKCGVSYSERPIRHWDSPRVHFAPNPVGSRSVTMKERVLRVTIDEGLSLTCKSETASSDGLLIEHISNNSGSEGSGSLCSSVGPQTSGDIGCEKKRFTRDNSPPILVLWAHVFHADCSDAGKYWCLRNQIIPSNQPDTMPSYETMLSLSGCPLLTTTVTTTTTTTTITPPTTEISSKSKVETSPPWTEETASEPTTENLSGCPSLATNTIIVLLAIFVVLMAAVIIYLKWPEDVRKCLQKCRCANQSSDPSLPITAHNTTTTDASADAAQQSPVPSPPTNITATGTSANAAYYSPVPSPPTTMTATDASADTAQQSPVPLSPTNITATDASADTPQQSPVPSPPTNITATDASADTAQVSRNDESQTFATTSPSTPTNTSVEEASSPTEDDLGCHGGTDPNSSNSLKERKSDSGKTCNKGPAARAEETDSGAPGNEDTTNPQDGGKVDQGSYDSERRPVIVSDPDCAIDVR